jgi:Fur family ferric uptake transcriptional regulator/Fur family peroxide stress response transcriptional regulator
MKGENRMEVVKRNTVQKSTVEHIVLSSCDHPTAETIYERVREIIPTISLGTVYRILGDLVASGKVRRIAVPEAPDRFDKTTCTHAHFHCSQCGAVVDIATTFGKEYLDGLSTGGNIIVEAEVVFKGICANCNKKAV